MLMLWKIFFYIEGHDMLKKVIVGFCLLRAISIQAVADNVSLYDLIHKGDVKKVEDYVNKPDIKIDAADLAFAAQKGCVEIVSLLLAKRAPIDDSVMQAAIRGARSKPKAHADYEELVKMLLQRGAPFDKEVLVAAVASGNIAIVAMLVDALQPFSAKKAPTMMNVKSRL
jgi:hypothetical protein